MLHLDLDLTDDELDQLTKQAFAQLDLMPDQLRVSCDPYGVPAVWLTPQEIDY